MERVQRKKQRKRKVIRMDSREYAKLTKKLQDRLGVVQEILRKSTDFLRRVIAPVGGMGGVTLSYVCPHCNISLWWVATGHGDSRKKKKHCSWWCAVCGGTFEWRAPNRILVVQLGTDVDDAKVNRAHVAPQGLCQILSNALKPLANEKTDGDSAVQSMVTGCEQRTEKALWMG